MTLTCLNITYVVNYVAKFVEWPTTTHWTTIKQIFRYLQGIVDFGLLYFERVNNNILMGYCDCDFTSNPNDCKSRTRYVFTIAKATIVWTNKCQGCTSLSTTKVEYVATCAATKEAIWLWWLLGSMGVPHTFATPLHCDKQSAIWLVKNPTFHCRTNHIKLQYHFIYEQFAANEIDLIYIASVDQLVNMLMKSLIVDKTQHFCKLMGVVSQSSIPFNAWSWSSYVSCFAYWVYLQVMHSFHFMYEWVGVLSVHSSMRMLTSLSTPFLYCCHISCIVHFWNSKFTRDWWFTFSFRGTINVACMCLCA
jgi:hypothetical protein